MQIVVLDGYTLNPGDLSWGGLEALGDCEIHDRTSPELIVPRAALMAWCDAAGKTALGIWIVYALSSMISTYMAWGVLVAWNEPRVVASIQVLAAALLIAGVNHFVDHLHIGIFQVVLLNFAQAAGSRCVLGRIAAGLCLYQDIPAYALKSGRIDKFRKRYCADFLQDIRISRVGLHGTGR